MKCARGKCSKFAESPKNQYVPIKKRKQQNLRRNLQHLRATFIKVGREKRIKNLKEEIHNLNLVLSTAMSRVHRAEINENFVQIERHLKTLNDMKNRIKKTKTEISHIKSQFERIDQKQMELNCETEADG
jgi:chromosome segregation ATPase